MFIVHQEFSSCNTSQIIPFFVALHVLCHIISVLLYMCNIHDVATAKLLTLCSLYTMRREMLYLFVILSVLCGACSTEGIYYVKPADVSTCPGQPCHNLSYYSENSQLFFTSNTTLYFLPGEHILGPVIVAYVSNITLVGIMSAEYAILHCPGEGGIAFINCKEIYLLHLTFSNCGADYGTLMYRGVGFQCVTGVEISNIVVTNSTGFGLYASNVVGSVHIQNSVFTYNSGNSGGNARFEYTEVLWYECPQVSDTLLFIESSIFAYGENWSREFAFSGGVTIMVIEYLYNIDIIVTNTTLHGNKVAFGGGGGLRIQHTSGDEPHQFDAREPQLTLHITDVNFVNNTAVHGGNFLIMDDSSVYNDVNITNSSIIGGQAEQGGGVFVLMKAPHDRMERRWNDSEYCNTHTPRISEKRLTIWN